MGKVLLVNQDQIRAHVYTLAGELGEHNVFCPQSLNAAADYIRDVWSYQGYKTTSQSYRVKGQDCCNLEVVCPGCEFQEQIILIGAHYDSVSGSPGANDNASGVAALLELTRLFTVQSPGMTVKFVAFVNEEPPFFFWNQMGSMIYATHARKRGDTINCMVSLETIGYYCHQPGCQRYPPFFRYFFPDRGDYIAFVSNLRSRDVLRQAVKAFRRNSDFPVESLATLFWIPGIAWSDHLSFWRQGYKAFMITDTAFYRYPYYHTAEDTPEKIDYESLARVTEGLYHMLRELAAERSVYNR